MKTFSRAMSQGDKSTDVLHKEKYSHNCKLEETFCTARTTARERERERAVHKSALASGYQTAGSTSACLKKLNFLKVSKHTVSLTVVHVKPFSRCMRNTTVF